MTSIYSANLLAQATGAGGGSPFGGIVPIVLMFVIFYFIIIRPQRLKQKELEKLIASVKVGDHVIMNGGEHGIITSVKERTVMVKVADNVKIEWERHMIGTITKKSDVVEATTTDA